MRVYTMEYTHTFIHHIKIIFIVTLLCWRERKMVGKVCDEVEDG